jgi:hypothetical protein
LRASLSIGAILPSADPPPAPRRGLGPRLAIPRPRIVFLGVVVLGLLAWGVERLVVTDREAIEHLLERTAAAAGRGDWDGVAGALADAFRSQQTRQDKGPFLSWLRSAWESFGRPAPRVAVRETAVEGDTAASRVRVTVAGFPVAIDARIELVRTDDGWRIARLVEYATGGLAR